MQQSRKVMKQFLMTLIIVCGISTSCFASDGSVTVNGGKGTYQVGFKGCPTAPKAPDTPRGTNGIPQPKSNFFRF